MSTFLYRTEGRQYVAKSLQKYILSLAQQVATQQGRPLVISTLVGRLHRRLQNTTSTSSPEGDESDNDGADDDDNDNKKSPIDISTDSDRDEGAGPSKGTRSAKKKKAPKVSASNGYIYVNKSTLSLTGHKEASPSRWTGGHNFCL